MGYNRRSVQGSPSPSKVGNSLAVESVILKGGDYDRNFAGTQVWNIPFPLFNTVIVEGVDTPFQERAIQDRLPDQRKVLQRKLFYWWNGIPDNAYALQNQPVDTAPLFFSRLYDLPDSHAKLRLYKAAFVSASFQDAPGVDPAIPPEDDYGVPAKELLEEIQYHTLVQPDGGVTWDLWTLAEVLNYLNERIAKFMIDTGIIQDTFSQSASANPVVLPSGVMKLRRVAWDGKKHT